MLASRIEKNWNVLTLERLGYHSEIPQWGPRTQLSSTVTWQSSDHAQVHLGDGKGYGFKEGQAEGYRQMFACRTLARWAEN
jgi:hypothetical protein